MKKWTKEQEDYLKEVYYKRNNEEIAHLINNKFNSNYTKCAIQCKKEKLNLVSGSKKQPRIWTKEVVDFMIENYQGKDNIELADLLNKKFNLNTNEDRVSNIKANLKRRKGIDLRTGINRGCFQKGQEPLNKGKKWDDYLTKEKQERCRTTTFKKGHRPLNYRPVGSERITVDGYTEIKIKEPNVWVGKHRYIYEKHYGKIPEGYNVMFADKNKQNFDIDNLILVSKHEDLIMNSKKLLYNDKELTKSGHLVAKVISKTRGLKNKELKNEMDIR